MNTILPLDFFNRPALEVAPELLGRCLVRAHGGTIDAFIINEVEAYIGAHDLACHARVGKTARTAALFGPPGHFYIYRIYGLHWMLNVVCDRDGYPSGVLIRGAGTLSGPARLTKALGITKALYGCVASPETGLWFEDRGHVVKPAEIIATPRIGVEYAGEWAEKPYRFLIQENLGLKV